MRAIYVCILSCTSLSHAAPPPISTPSGPMGLATYSGSMLPAASTEKAPKEAVGQGMLSNCLC
jgi:hypothetical protein